MVCFSNKHERWFQRLLKKKMSVSLDRGGFRISIFSLEKSFRAFGEIAGVTLEH